MLFMNVIFLKFYVFPNTICFDRVVKTHTNASIFSGKRMMRRVSIVNLILNFSYKIVLRSFRLLSPLRREIQHQYVWTMDY